MQRDEQFAVARLVDEFCRTGELREHVPTEVDIVHRVARIYREEKQWNQQREQRLASRQTVVTAEPQDRSSDEVGPEPAVIPFVARAGSPASPSRGSLSATAALIRVPAIGPKTAARFTRDRH